MRSTKQFPSPAVATQAEDARSQSGNDRFFARWRQLRSAPPAL